MSTTYEQTTVTQTASTDSSPSISPDIAYVKSIPGILKIIQLVLSIIVLICSSTAWYASGYGWVQFVAVLALITISIFFVFHFLRIIHRLPGPWVFIEFIYYCVMTGFWVIAFIVAVAHPYFSGAMIATVIFTVFATVAFAIDTFFNFRGWRAVQHPGASAAGPGTTTGTTTTTSTAYETRTQY